MVENCRIIAESLVVCAVLYIAVCTIDYTVEKIKDYQYTHIIPAYKLIKVVPQ